MDKEVFVKHITLMLSLVALASCATGQKAQDTSAQPTQKNEQVSKVQSELRQTLYSQLSYDFK